MTTTTTTTTTPRPPGAHRATLTLYPIKIQPFLHIRRVIQLTRNQQSNNYAPPSPTKLPAYNLKRLGGALHAEKRGDAARVSIEATNTLAKLAREYLKLDDNDSNKRTNLRQFIMIERRKAYKELYHARLDEIVSRVETRDGKRIPWALQRGSTKNLVKGGSTLACRQQLSAQIIQVT